MNINNIIQNYYDDNIQKNIQDPISFGWSLYFSFIANNINIAPFLDGIANLPALFSADDATYVTQFLNWIENEKLQSNDSFNESFIIFLNNLTNLATPNPNFLSYLETMGKLQHFFPVLTSKIMNRNNFFLALTTANEVYYQTQSMSEAFNQNNNE